MRLRLLEASHKLQWWKTEDGVSRNPLDSGLLLIPFAGFISCFCTNLPIAEFNDAGLTAKNLGHPDSTLLRKDYNGAVSEIANILSVRCVAHAIIRIAGRRCFCGMEVYCSRKVWLTRVD